MDARPPAHACVRACMSGRLLGRHAASACLSPSAGAGAGARARCTARATGGGGSLNGCKEGVGVWGVLRAGGRGPDQMVILCAMGKCPPARVPVPHQPAEPGVEARVLSERRQRPPARPAACLPWKGLLPLSRSPRRVRVRLRVQPPCTCFIHTPSTQSLELAQRCLRHAHDMLHLQKRHASMRGTCLPQLSTSQGLLRHVVGLPGIKWPC